jgi:IrrE N-terminal-like domain
MDQRLTSEQYRRLAEGLLKKATEEVLTEQKQNLIRDALAYLTYARAQEERVEPEETIDESAAESQRREVRLLIKQALEAPTSKELVDFLNFATNFRRLSIWNAHMAHIQRPGACIIASEYEWKSVGRFVKPDAVPIIILWPRSPIRFVYELEDTGPDIDREAINDPFAVRGTLQPKAMSALLSGLEKQKAFRVTIQWRPQGFARAGSAASNGPLNGSLIGEFARINASTSAGARTTGIPSYRITVNRRLQLKEAFATIAHELGHIFCGHLGRCASINEEESGWPDRSSLKKPEQEIEAEAVAYLVASRTGIIPASAQYLKDHAARSNIDRIDLDLIVHAAARIERIAKIRHGSMVFEKPTQSLYGGRSKFCVQ